jgi:type II secretory pathway pseudopilin PulG
VVCIAVACGSLLLVAILGIVASIAIPILLSARVGAVNEKARNALRGLVAAEAAYYAAHQRYGTLADLGGASPAYLDSELASGDAGHGVTLSVTLAADGKSYLAEAVANGGTAPYHSYSADQTGLIEEH